MAKLKGTIQHSDLEGGMWVLEADDGERYQLVLGRREGIDDRLRERHRQHRPDFQDLGGCQKTILVMARAPVSDRAPCQYAFHPGVEEFQQQHPAASFLCGCADLCVGERRASARRRGHRNWCDQQRQLLRD